MRRARPSQTAVKASLIPIYLAQDPKLSPLLAPGMIEYSERLLTRAGYLKPWIIALYRKPWYRRFITFIERHTTPGQSLEFGLRKRFFEEETRAAIARGARQVLTVGAGFDTLCLRLSAEYPEITFVETDHPATSEVKRSAAEAMGALRPNLHLHGVDLAQERLVDFLAKLPAWRPDHKSVVIAEAVLMYIPEAAVIEFLQQVCQSTGPGSSLLFSYMRTDAQGKIWLGKNSFFLRAALKIMGEPVLWGVMPGALEEILRKNGYEPDLSPERCDLALRYLAPASLDLPLGGIEFMAAATMRLSAEDRAASH